MYYHGIPATLHLYLTVHGVDGRWGERGGGWQAVMGGGGKGGGVDGWWLQTYDYEA